MLVCRLRTAAADMLSCKVSRATSLNRSSFTCATIQGCKGEYRNTPKLSYSSNMALHLWYICEANKLNKRMVWPAPPDMCPGRSDSSTLERSTSECTLFFELGASATGQRTTPTNKPL